MSLETERGLPLALGNSLGPVAERGSSNGGGGRGGRVGEEGREGRVEFKRVFDTGTLSIGPFLGGFYLTAFTLEVNFTPPPLP